MKTTCAVLLSLFSCSLASAEDVKPLKALLITGGGYHDYQNQKKILSEGISARANVEWTVVLEDPEKGALPKVYADTDWAKGYDVIVHNECYASYTEDAGIERIVKAHLEEGVGAVMIHCAMHTFRDGTTKEWDKLVGVESRRHGPKFPIVIKNLAPKHPITRDYPGTHTTPMGELYHTQLLASATALGVGFKQGEEKETSQICIWANQYEKCRIFGTTLGHHNETMQEEVYLDLVTRGLLWSCGKLGEDGKPLDGYGKTAAAPIKFRVYLAGAAPREFKSERSLLAAGLTFKADANCCGR